MGKKNCIMDNFIVVVEAYGSGALARAFGIFEFAMFSKAKSFSVQRCKDGDVLSFWWCEPNAHVGRMPLLIEHNIEMMRVLAEQWLGQAAYPSEPDIDGDNEKGFRISNESCEEGEILQVTPVWAIQSK